MATIAAPRAPRAMVQRSRVDYSALPEVFNEAANKLYPKLVLYEALARFNNEFKPRELSDDEICEARRDFLDSFAYLCDIEKGGATVTATGLQELEYSNILWLAANEGIRKDVEIYAKNILGKLRTMDQEDQAVIEDDIFRLAVEKCSTRINFYTSEMQKLARNCRMQLRQELRDDTVRNIRSKLRKLSEPSSNMTSIILIDFCYGMRGDEVDTIKAKSKTADDDFSRLAHYIGRLSATRSKTKIVVQATMKVPALQNISDIRTIKPPEPRTVSIDSDHISPYEIVRAICIESTSQNPKDIHLALHAIVDHDSPISSNVRSALASRKIITRVHAELQIADKFSRDRRSGMKFVDDDKYVGCSKPACYFCYNWICNHRYGYIPPATHHKIIAGCRGPDDDLNEVGVVFLRDMYIKVGKTLDQDILRFLLSSQQGSVLLEHRYMSTEGSSYPPSEYNETIQ